MGPNPILIAGVAALAAALLAPTGASAQWNNEPYQFRSNIGGGAGMSMAYRQAILNEELFNRRPDNLVRGANGALLEIIERDQQAFLAESEPNLIVRGGRRGGSGLFIGGAGFGIGGAVDGWTGAVNPRAYGYLNPGGGSPIDTWVGMLD